MDFINQKNEDRANLEKKEKEFKKEIATLEGEKKIINEALIR